MKLIVLKKELFVFFYQAFKIKTFLKKYNIRIITQTHIKPTYIVFKNFMYVRVNDFDAKAWSAFCYFDNVIRDKRNKRNVRYGLV